MIYGARVRLARELHALTQTELATALVLSAGRVAQIEGEQTVSLSDDVLQRLTATTNFPPSFFSRPPVDELGEGSLFFRAQKAMSKKQARAARRHGELVNELVSVLGQHLTLIDVRVPSLPRVTPEVAARQTRAALGVPPDAPIKRVMHVVERGGGVVMALPVRNERHDAYSTWTGAYMDRPLIAVFADAPWDRLRFSVAHELGHLVLHRAPAGDVEFEANRFAGEFLFPTSEVMHEMRRPVTLATLAPLKVRWGMSISALIERAKATRLITDDQRTSLYKQLNTRGWKKQEPGWDAYEPEQPRALRKMAELVYGNPIKVRDLARDLDWHPHVAQLLLAGHAAAPALRASAREAAGEVVPMTRRRAPARRERAEG